MVAVSVAVVLDRYRRGTRRCSGQIDAQKARGEGTDSDSHRVYRRPSRRGRDHGRGSASGRDRDRAVSP